MTDGKPSLTLYRLRNLNDNKCIDAIIKSIFLEQLPSQCRVILASSNIEDLQKLAELADQIVKATNSGKNYAAAVSADVASVSVTDDKIVKLTKAITDLTHWCKSNVSTRPRSRSQTRGSSSRSQSKDRNSGICWAHRKFGRDARKCKKPCAWRDEPKTEK